MIKVIKVMMNEDEGRSTKVYEGIEGIEGIGRYGIGVYEGME